MERSQGFSLDHGLAAQLEREARIYAKYLMKEKPDGKIAVMYQNHDFGKDYLKGLKDGLGPKVFPHVVAEESYETTEADHRQSLLSSSRPAAPTSSSTSPRRNSPPRRSSKIAEIEWKPLHIVANVSASVGGVMKPAGFENAQGILSRRLRQGCAPIRNGTMIPG